MQKGEIEKGLKKGWTLLNFDLLRWIETQQGEADYLSAKVGGEVSQKILRSLAQSSNVQRGSQWNHSSCRAFIFINQSIKSFSFHLAINHGSSQRSMCICYRMSLLQMHEVGVYNCYRLSCCGNCYCVECNDGWEKQRKEKGIEWTCPMFAEEKKQKVRKKFSEDS